MKRLSDFTDSELVAEAQKTVAKYTKAYTEAKAIAEEYGFAMGEMENDILNAVFVKLKEKRDAVTRESVEKSYQNALALLIKSGFYSKVKELINLFDNGQFLELKNALVNLNFECPAKKSSAQKNSRTKLSSSKDYSDYFVNGTGRFAKGHVAKSVIELYAKKNPQKSSVEIVDTFRNVFPSRYERFFMTEKEFRYKLQASEDSNFARRYDEIVLPSGERVYSSNQYDVERITEFMNYVNHQNWGIIIEKL